MATETAKARRTAKETPGWYDSELAWYANERDGEMGIHGMPLEPGTGGTPQHDGVSDHQVRAATRSRKIEFALQSVHPDARLLLLAVHYRISPRAHQDRHAAQAKCIAAREGEIAIGVAVFRRAMVRGC
jgi:hypothetical protein